MAVISPITPIHPSSPISPSTPISPIIKRNTKNISMEYSAKKPFRWLCCMLLAAAAFTSCGMMEDDLKDCPYGLYVSFKYDYNLQRADMFNDHVGSVTLYIFDEQGKLVKTQEESNVGAVAPLKDAGYAMHITDLAPGRYQFIALAGQRPYADMLADSRARFVRNDLAAGDDMTAVGVQLDRVQTGSNMYDIVNNALPLDTLWHGMLTEPVQVYSREANRAAYATVPLVRDTKRITVSLREISDPREMDIADYEMTITDKNSTLLWDNSVDETTGTVVYRPYATWNTDDLTPPTDQNGNVLEGVGHTGHAEFMTSRLISHDDRGDDGVLAIRNKNSNTENITVNLPDILSRLANYDEMRNYSKQEFLDRGYDYDLEFFLLNGKLQYINVSISVLGWTKRVQFEEL